MTPTLSRSAASDAHSPITTPPSRGKGVAIATTLAPAPRHGALAFFCTSFGGGGLMGRRGPAAAPAQLKLIKWRGNGKDVAGRAISDPPKFDRDAPEPPEWLSELAREQWDLCAPALDQLDLLKPAWAFVCRTALVKTIAEWVPATKRALADVAALEGLINDELRADVAEAEEGQILSGDGTGENFTGITAWSGIQTQAFATDLLTSIRKGITKCRTVGRVNRMRSSCPRQRPRPSTCARMEHLDPVEVAETRAQS